MGGPGIEYRWEARFSASVHTGPGAHPASCAMGDGFLLSGVKGRRHGVEHLPTSSAEVKERVGLYLYSPSGPSRIALQRILRFIHTHSCDILYDVTKGEILSTEICIFFTETDKSGR